MVKISDSGENDPKKRNCWEVMVCERQPGGENAVKLGVCPAAADQTFDGINSGKCGGRICWAVAGTFCDGCVQGSFADKRSSCKSCNFYQMVREEEATSGRHTGFLQFVARLDRSPFFDQMRMRRVKAGQRFVIQGAVEDTAFIIQSGSCLVVVEKDGQLYPVDHYGEGDIVGGLGILTGEPRRAHVEAETDMKLWVMTRAQFEQMTQKDPDLLDFITELVADRLDSRRPTAYRTIGKYVATDIIGRGAFSIVYKGRHTGLNRPVVIKMLRHDMVQYEDFIDNFRNEAKIIARLGHEHIVKVYDFEERYRTLFIIMEFVRGRPLKEMIEHLRALPYRLTQDFLRQIGSALEYAHACGIIHRDINPSNIIVQPNDRLKILDFGLACPAGTEDYSNAGTVFYMSPEQIDGEPVDARTDIYALGVMAYEMVTGRRPFPETDIKKLLDLHRTCDLPDPQKELPDLPENLRRFILKCGRRDPRRRFQDMEAALAALGSERIDSLPRYQKQHPDKGAILTLKLFCQSPNQSDFRRRLEAFGRDIRALGADIEITTE